MIASTVPEKVKEMTAARYLSRAWPLLPSHAVRDAFSKKDVKVNGARVLPDAPVRGGDRVEVSCRESEDGAALREAESVTVLGGEPLPELPVTPDVPADTGAETGETP